MAAGFLCIVIDGFGELKYFKIKLTYLLKFETNIQDVTTYQNEAKYFYLTIPGIELYYILNEIRLCLTFRKILRKILSFHEKNLVLQIVAPKQYPLDYRGNKITAVTVWERVETENMMSWLSTLGGGFSALGDHITYCAETAGKISLKQLRICTKLGDPFLQARARLFYSISLIQTGKLRRAKYVIREQYRFAKKHEEYDIKLVRMCEGVWLKLQFSYYQRIENRRKAERSLA